MKLKIIFPVFVLGISLSACNSNSPSSNNNASEETPAANAESSAVEIKGQAVYEQKCASCHGSNGTAGIGNAANLQRSKLDSVSILKVITEGKGGMPSFNGQLTKEELNDLSSYVIVLRK